MAEVVVTRIMDRRQLDIGVYGMREIIFTPVLVPPEVGRGVGCCHGGYRTYPASESRYYVEETRSLGIADKKIIT